MPRIAQIVAARYPHHITQRGNYRQKIFADDTNRRKYVLLLKEYNGFKLHNFTKYSKWRITLYLYAFHHFYVIWNYYFLRLFVLKAFRSQRTRHAVSLRECHKNARRVSLNARKNLKNRQFTTLILGYFCLPEILKPL